MPRKSHRRPAGRRAGSDSVSEVHPASETNAEVEGARTPTGGSTHGGETPPEPRGQQPGQVGDEMAPVPGAFAAEAVTSAQPTTHRGDQPPPPPPSAEDASRDFGRPREVAAPAPDAPVRRVPVIDGRGRERGKVNRKQ